MPPRSARAGVSPARGLAENYLWGVRGRRNGSPGQRGDLPAFGVRARPRRLAVPLILAATLGQMVGKVVMYYAARGAVKLPWRWMGTRSAPSGGTVPETEGLGGLVLFSSADRRLPAILCRDSCLGAAAHAPRALLVVGFTGRLIRFTVVVLLPQLAKDSLPM